MSGYAARVVHTHELTFAGTVLTKRYRSWSRDEHRREWSVLQRVHRHAPDLVPRPLAADLDADPPSITMTVVRGEPMQGVPTAIQLDGLAAALKELWAVPHDSLAPVGSWTDDLDFARRLTAGPRPSGRLLAAAYDAALAWWDGPDPPILQTPPRVTVLGHRDPNLANYLWDGQRMRIVDLEDADVSDPATEVAILVEHLSARQLDSEEFCARFEVDPVRLRAGRRLWAMFWLRLLSPGGVSAERNPPGTAEAQARRLLDLLGS
ncbi:MAG: phosphotransferase [Mycobacterium sp.]|nr:phosphotransferase [Mycobacterium sp.]